MTKDINHKKLGRQKKKHQRLCFGLQILGILITLTSFIEITLALGFDRIASRYDLSHTIGTGLEQWLIALIGVFGILIGIFLFILGRWAK